MLVAVVLTQLYILQLFVGFLVGFAMSSLFLWFVARSFFSEKKSSELKRILDDVASQQRRMSSIDARFERRP